MTSPFKCPDNRNYCTTATAQTFETAISSFMTVVSQLGRVGLSLNFLLEISECITMTKQLGYGNFETEYERIITGYIAKVPPNNQVQCDPNINLHFHTYVFRSKITCSPYTNPISF